MPKRTTAAGYWIGPFPCLQSATKKATAKVWGNAHMPMGPWHSAQRQPNLISFTVFTVRCFNPLGRPPSPTGHHNTNHHRQLLLCIGFGTSELRMLRISVNVKLSTIEQREGVTL